MRARSSGKGLDIECSDSQFKETRSKMSFTNTQAALFTTIPTNVERKWSAIPVSAETGIPVPTTSDRHEHALIADVTLTVKFNSLLGNLEDILTNESDERSDRIIAWQEARQDYAALERAVSTEIDRFIKRSRERAKSTNTYTIDALQKRETTKDSARSAMPFSQKATFLGSTMLPATGSIVNTVPASVLEPAWMHNVPQSSIAPSESPTTFPHAPPPSVADTISQRVIDEMSRRYSSNNLLSTIDRPRKQHHKKKNDGTTILAFARPKKH
jgi:hypothetical protein